MLLSSLLLLLIMLFQCVSKEGEIIPSDDPSADILEQMGAPTVVEDVDPEVKEPDFNSIFSSEDPLDLLSIFAAIAKGGDLNASSIKILETIKEHLNNLDPETQSMIENLDLDFIMQILDRNNPLDPQLEVLFKKILEMENELFPPIELIKIEDVGGANKEMIKILSQETAGIELHKEGLRTTDHTDICTIQVEDEYGSGYRICGQTYMNNLEMVDDNFRRRYFEAEERYLTRQQILSTLYDQRLSIKAAFLEQLSNTLLSLEGSEHYGQIKSQIGFLGLLYAYYVRGKVYNYFLLSMELNDRFFETEVQQFAEIRNQKYEEVEEIYNSCFARVGEIIAEEIERRCGHPAEE